MAQKNWTHIGNIGNYVSIYRVLCEYRKDDHNRFRQIAFTRSKEEADFISDLLNKEYFGKINDDGIAFSVFENNLYENTMINDRFLRSITDGTDEEKFQHAADILANIWQWEKDRNCEYDEGEQ